MGVNFSIHILGASAAIPTSVRHTTAQLVNYRNRYFLLDCCEGCQTQLRRYRLPMLKIDHIFISHLHGDHYLGLPGLIFSMHLLGRKKKLHIYAPEGLKEIIELQYSISRLEPGFNIQYHLVKKGGVKLYDDGIITVESIEMVHSLPTFGFLIREREAQPNIKKEIVEAYDLPVETIKDIKAGGDLKIDDETVIPHAELTIPPHLPRSYAFCSDTGFTESYIEQISHVDLLYHEATFLQDKTDIAKEKNHCTALQAATIAEKASVGKLLMGHYSARYDELDLFLDEARSVFENSSLAEEGMVFEIESGRDKTTISEKKL